MGKIENDILPRKAPDHFPSENGPENAEVE
jgi:hypothetical protein